MKNVTIVKLSRPLLLVTGQYQDGYLYQTVYGCVVPSSLGDMAYYKVHDYVGYLAGLHCWANGYKLFNINFEIRGVPDWVDKKGKVHMRQDSWMERIGEKCMEKIGLSYELIIGSIDDETYSKYVNNCDLVINEELFYELEGPIEEEASGTSEAPFWEEIPF